MKTHWIYYSMSNTTLQVPSGLSGVASRFFNCKGQFLSVSFTSEVKPKASFKNVKLTKQTEGVFRAGINFENLSVVKEGIESGERGEVQSLPWGTWEHFPYTILHNDQRYIRLYPTENAHLKVQYLVDGVQVDKEVFKTYLIASDVKRMESGERPLVICPKESNIIKIG